jgi:hypothetical protein
MSLLKIDTFTLKFLTMKRLITILISAAYLNLYGQIRVDYRAYQSPVKNQKGRGTCTAFSVCAALETFPGFPNDLSEQHLYANIKMNYYDKMPNGYEEGAFIKYYIDYLQKHGAVAEEFFPYQPNSVVWEDHISDFEKMKKDISESLFDLLSFFPFTYKISPAMYTYKEGADATDVNWVKSQLDKGVKALPVSYRVNGAYWAAHRGNRNQKMTPDDLFMVKIGNNAYTYRQAVFLDPDIPLKWRRGQIELLPKNPSLNANEGHAVAIVGYDESGFLIKNSWGTEWGDKGYGWVSFEYHRLLAEEVLSLHMGKVQVNEGIKGEPGDWSPDDFKLKSLPHRYVDYFTKKEKQCIELSIVYKGKRQMPRLKEIEYKFYDENEKLLETDYGDTYGIFDGRESGYNTVVRCVDLYTQPKAAKVVAKITTENGERFTNTYYNLEATNKEYRTLAGRLIDLLGK